MDENPILMHFDSPYHRGPVENATHVGYARSASCGDEVRLYLIVDQGVVTTAGFVASGCMVCQAAASILCEAVESRRIPQLELMTTEIMLELIGVPLTLRVTVQQGHIGCRCRGTRGVGACQRRLGCRW